MTLSVYAKEFVIHAEYNCPYFCDEKVSKKTGYVFELLSLFFIKQGFTLKVNHIPYPRIFSQLKLNNSQLGILPLIDIHNHAKVKSFTSSIGINFSAIAIRTKEQFNYISLEDLKGRRVSLRPGGIEAYQIRSKLKSLNGNIDQVQSISGTDINTRMLKMLIHKRTDVVISDYNVLRYLNSKLPKALVTIEPIALVRFSPLYIAFENKIDNFDTLNLRFTQFIQEMRSSGKLKKILNEYNLEDWKKFVAK